MSENNNDKTENVKRGEHSAERSGRSNDYRRQRHGGYRNGERRNNYQGNRHDRENGENRNSPKENIAQRESGRNIADVPVKKSIQAQNSGETNTEARENVHNQRNPKHQKNGYSRDFQRNRDRNVKVEETREDIIRDIGRIEKEIELEIKEISALKFGM